MPKTRDAFALRKLYDSCCEFYGDENGWFRELIEPNYVADGRDDTDEYKYLQSGSCLVEESILEYLKPDEFPDESFPEIEKVKREMKRYQKLIIKNREKSAKIERHVVTLQNFSQRIFDGVMTNGLSCELKKLGYRVKTLINNYEGLLILLRGYEDILKQDWRKADSVFQKACRKELGNRLRQARLRKGITMEQIAKMLSLSRVGYGYYELGQRDLPTPTIYRLAEILEVSTDWLFGLKE